MACTQYQADVLAAEFGQCKCGYPKQSHVTESENKAAAAKRALRPTTRGASKLQCEPCSDYVVDVSASTFGQCYCGHPKDAHVCKSENKAATERAKLYVKEQESLRVSTRTANMLEPCSDFKVDTKAETFGTCICGHPQDAHKIATVNPAEAALRALKEKNVPTETVCEEKSDANMENDIVVEASPEVEACQNGGDEEEIKTAPILELPLRYDFGFGIGVCSVCRSFCRNRGCKDSNLTFCHRCWPAYICGIAV